MTAESRFLLGANLPWLRYGGDFGASAWAPAGGLSQRSDGTAIVERLQLLRSRGVELLRWFVLCDGRAGLKVEPDGTPAGLDAFFERDFEVALDWAGAAGLRLLPVLLDFQWCRRRRMLNGVQMGGRRAILARADRRQALVDRVVAPLLARFGRDERVYAWDLFNEPEWVTFGVAAWNPLATISRRALQAYLRLAADRVHALTTQHATVGSASTRYLPLVQGLGLDFYAPHWYDRFEARAPLSTPVSELGCDAPVLLGEFPTRNSAVTTDGLLAVAKDAGYSGALFWSVNAADDSSAAD